MTKIYLIYNNNVYYAKETIFNLFFATLNVLPKTITIPHVNFEYRYHLVVASVYLPALPFVRAGNAWYCKLFAP